MPFPLAALRSCAVESNSLVGSSFPFHCCSTWLSPYQLPSTPCHPTLLIPWKQRLPTSRSSQTSDCCGSCTQQACCYTAWYSIRASDLGEWAKPTSLNLQQGPRFYWWPKSNKWEPTDLSKNKSPLSWVCNHLLVCKFPVHGSDPQASSIKKCFRLKTAVLPSSVDWANCRYSLLN